MKKTYMLILASLAASALAFFAWQQAQEPLGIKPEAKVKIGNQTLQVEIAQTVSETEKGLSGRKYLADNAGMLFEIGSAKSITFWMKDMLFPLDIIWIDGDTIIGIEKSAQPPGITIPTFPSPQPVTKVLEVRGGWTEINKVAVGSKIEVLK